MTAADKILQKALVGSGIDSRQWSAVQAGLRDRAFFSATVEDVRVLGAGREAAARLAAGETDPSSALIAMRDALTAAGYRPPDAEDQGPGGIRNLMNERRLDLILKTNVQQARGWAQYMEGTTQGALLAYPAQRLVRVRQRRMPRDWTARWKEAGNAVGWQGACRDEFVALKLSPIWAALSRFGNPYPPFDFNSGMGVEDVGKRKARELGLLEGEGGGEGEEQGGAGAQPPSVVPSFNANLQATVPFNDVSPEWATMKRAFGDQIRKVGDKVMWREEVLRETVLHGKNFTVKLGVPQRGMLDKLADADAAFAEAIRGKALTVDQTWRDAKRPDGTDHTTHFYPDPDHPEDIPLTPGDMELLPWIWRSPDTVRKLQKDIFEATLDALDGGILVAQFKLGALPRLWTFYKKSAGPVPQAGSRPHGQFHSGKGSTPRTRKV